MGRVYLVNGEAFWTKCSKAVAPSLAHNCAICTPEDNTGWKQRQSRSVRQSRAFKALREDFDPTLASLGKSPT